MLKEDKLQEGVRVMEEQNQQNKAKVIVAVTIIVIAFLCVGTGLFISKDKAGRKAREAREAEQLAQLSRQAQENSASQTKAIPLNSILQEAQKIYEVAESSRKEGYLWVDRKESMYVATLGAINGLLPGGHVNIYDGETKIGEAQVEVSFDVISYVQPITPTSDQLNKDYYRVAME